MRRSAQTRLALGNVGDGLGPGTEEAIIFPPSASTGWVCSLHSQGHTLSQESLSSGDTIHVLVFGLLGA